jgi:hypothetical protein
MKFRLPTISNIDYSTMPKRRYQINFALLPTVVREKWNEPQSCLIWFRPYWVMSKWNENASWWEDHKNLEFNGRPTETKTEGAE